MARNAMYTVPFRRKREGRTNYKRRLDLLKSGDARLVIRLSNSSVTLQCVQYSPQGDRVVSTFNSNRLENHGWKYSKHSLPAAYLAGLVAGKQFLAKGVSKAILDLGLQTPKSGSRLYAALKGVVDAGVEVPHNPEVFPSEERLSGQHIAAMGDELASKMTSYAKNKLTVKDLPKVFASVRDSIQGDDK